MSELNVIFGNRIGNALLRSGIKSVDQLKTDYENLFCRYYGPRGLGPKAQATIKKFIETGVVDTEVDDSVNITNVISLDSSTLRGLGDQTVTIFVTGDVHIQGPSKIVSKIKIERTKE